LPAPKSAPIKQTEVKQSSKPSTEATKEASPKKKEKPTQSSQGVSRQSVITDQNSKTQERLTSMEEAKALTSGFTYQPKKQVEEVKEQA